MKKAIRITVDYEVEINETVENSVQPGEYRRGTVERIQAVVDAIFLHPEVLQELLRHYLHELYIDSDLLDEDTITVRKIQTGDEIMGYLKPYLPPEFIPYCMKLFCCECDIPKFIDEDDGRGLLVSHLYKFIPSTISIEEIDKDGNPVIYGKG